MRQRPFTGNKRRKDRKETDDQSGEPGFSAKATGTPAVGDRREIQKGKEAETKQMF
jgi:hypothetical protein